MVLWQIGPNICSSNLANLHLGKYLVLNMSKRCYLTQQLMKLIQRHQLRYQRPKCNVSLRLGVHIRCFQSWSFRLMKLLWKGELYSKTILFLLRARRGLGTISKSSLQIHLHWPRLHGSYLFRDNNRVNFFHFSVQRMRTKSKRSDNQRQF
jgi:hypothetical protein